MAMLAVVHLESFAERFNKLSELLIDILPGFDIHMNRYYLIV